MRSKPNAVNIVVDWGTSNFRAYLVAENGNCLRRVETAEGLNNVQQPFSEVLLKHIDPWLQQHGALVTVLCGMVGSPGGWHLVPHLPAPASLMQLAEHCHRLTEFTHCPAWIVPGVSGAGHAGNYDVMRGEEVQFFGAQQLLPRSEHKAPQLLCFPGTHNKWIDASSSTLNNFSTTISGELFGLLSQQSILASSIDADAPWNDDAFTQGLDHAKQPGGLLHHLFGVRALNLNGQHSQE
ncbi:MAG: 2-dehydro-3-deoxygalactonokinase, partial [Pseudomonadota bacterium]|nr:2-dehydro-3-deoxygalactonokinase [Pseudomonadota bacterium]